MSIRNMCKVSTVMLDKLNPVFLKYYERKEAGEDEMKLLKEISEDKDVSDRDKSVARVLHETYSKSQVDSFLLISDQLDLYGVNEINNN